MIRSKIAGLSALGATAALALAACGGSSSPATSGHKEVITVWENWTTLTPGLTPLRNRLDRAFEKAYPQYTVDDNAVAYATQGTKLRAAIAASTGPNVRSTVTPTSSSTPSARIGVTSTPSTTAPGTTFLVLPLPMTATDPVGIASSALLAGPPSPEKPPLLSLRLLRR